MSGHYICDDCGNEDYHNTWCRNYRAPRQAEAKKMDSLPEGDLGVTRKWRPIETVADLVNNLLMLDQNRPIFTSHYRKEKSFANGVMISEEKIGENNTIDYLGDPPFSYVIWTAERPAAPIAWDHPTNRSYDPVETRAKEIYDAFEAPSGVRKPAWFAGGNSDKQDEARRIARRELHAAGHEPSSLVSRPHQQSEG